MEQKILDRINSPEDLRRLSVSDMQTLSQEIRETIIKTVAENGGHLAPNLGVVELTVALHRVFRAPEDKIIWDVGHQSYPHKLLTGRRKEFSSIRKYNGLSGFTKREESPYDCFGAGHAGTSISSAMGFSVASELKGMHNHTVAVIGDGSLICGISLEALNNLRSTCKNMIIVLNDNKMSISKSIGAIPNYLNQIITGRNYNRFKAYVKMMVQKMPGSASIIENIQNLEASAKNLFVPGIFFEELGIRYFGPIDGHNLNDLIQTFERVKEFNRPVIVHVITEKGHGCDYAIAAPEKYHGVGSFHPATGKNDAKKKETFSSAFGKKLFRMAEEHPEITAVTAAMASGCGISGEFTERFPDRFFDVGIAEEHALVFAAGLAADGMRPVVAVYATFLQRALDCIFHDICLQNLPVILCADRAGIVEDGATHHGIYDISFLRAIPNLAILEPRNEKELAMMMDSAYAYAAPVLLRYPRGCSDDDSEPAEIFWGKAERLSSGTDLAFWTSGREAVTARQTADILKEKYGISVSVVNARFLRPFDTEMFRADAEKMPVVTLEDHVTAGGLASIAAEALNNVKHRGLHSFGWSPDRIPGHGSTEELRREAGLYPEALAENIYRKIRGSYAS